MTAIERPGQSNGGVLKAEPEGRELIGSAPNHVAIIMDGNRRWAEGHGIPRIEGHRRGLNGNLEPVVIHAAKRGISELSIWAFSTENWKRGEVQVNELFRVFRETFDGNLVERFIEEGIRIRAIGRVAQFPEDIARRIREVEEQTKDGRKIIVNFALNYGGRAEIVDAVKEIVRLQIPLDQVDESVTEEMVSGHMYAPDMSPVDLIIRTGGEHRQSGFMLWEAHYAEPVTSQKLWPDFGPEDLDAALEEYAERDRRFGGNSTKSANHHIATT